MILVHLLPITGLERNGAEATWPRDRAAKHEPKEAGTEPPLSPRHEDPSELKDGESTCGGAHAEHGLGIMCRDLGHAQLEKETRP